MSIDPEDLLREADHEARVRNFTAALVQVDAMVEAGWKRNEALFWSAIYHAQLVIATAEKREGQ